LEFKHVSLHELAIIKAKIREWAKKSAEKEITIYGVCILIVLLFIGYIFFIGV